MSCQFVCDHCGKVQLAHRGKLQPAPPLNWAIGVLRGGFVHACSVECMAALREEHMVLQDVKAVGKTQIERGAP